MPQGSRFDLRQKNPSMTGKRKSKREYIRKNAARSCRAVSKLRLAPCLTAVSLGQHPLRYLTGKFFAK
jgi:hypothetical protein